MQKLPAILSVLLLSVLSSAATVPVQQDFGFSSWTTPGPSGTLYDASSARWDFKNSDADDPTSTTKGCSGPEINKYPVMVRYHDDLTLHRPLIEGHVSLTAYWGDLYGSGGACNAAAVYMRDGRGHVIDGARITRTWDGLRTSYWDSGHGEFTIRNSWVSDARDDCVENDADAAGVVQDSLFDGCFQGFSMRSSSTQDNSARTMVIDQVLMKIKAHNHSQLDGSRKRFVSGQVFKIDGTAPRLDIRNSVFAFDTPVIEGHESNTYMTMGDSRHGGSYGEKLKSCSNNKVLWMHDDDPPEVLRKLASCFTLVTGAQARAQWEAARCQWIADHPSTTTRRAPGDAACGIADTSTLAPQPPVVHDP